MSTGVGMLIVAASHHVDAAYIGILVPSALWLSKLPPQGDRLSSGRTFSIGVLTVPFGRLYERMGDDMLDWCDTRIRAASAKPQWIADAVTYYYDQVRGGLKDGQTRADLGRWQESITHKIGIVQLISLDTTPARLRESLRRHPSTQHISKDADDDPPRLARRMESDALSAAGPVPRLRLPARVSQTADLSVPAHRLPGPAPAYRADDPGSVRMARRARGAWEVRAGPICRCRAHARGVMVWTRSGAWPPRAQTGRAISRPLTNDHAA